MTRSLVGHADSFYAAQSGGMPLYEKLSGDRKTQVCVVGGGLAGLSCASELAQKGIDVILLEGNRLGWGASGRNGGFVSDGFALGMSDVIAKTGLETAQQLFAASVEGVEIVRANSETAGRQDLIAGHGGLKLIRTADMSGLRQQMVDYQTFFETERRLLMKDELNEHINSSRYFAALYNENAFHIDPLRYCEVLTQQAEAEGAALFEQSLVNELRATSSGWDVVCGNGTVHADHVVVATSGYGTAFPPISRALVPVATYVVASKPLGRALDGVLNFKGTMADTRRAGDYFRIVGEDDARRLIWGGRITTRRSEPKKLAQMLAKDIVEVFPQLVDIEIDHAWSGVMGYTRHKMPLIGEFWPKKHPGLWACTGFGGHGLNTTAIGGRLISEAIAETSDRIACFRNFKPEWAGGPAGRAAAQLSYWNMQRLDRAAERKSL